MSRILDQFSSKRSPRAFVGKSLPVQISFHNDHPNTLVFDDRNETPSCCVRCKDAPCVNLSPAETVISNFPDFPADRSESVCPSGALRLNGTNGAPIVDNRLCVFCGLCVIRCPVGAIRLDQKIGVVIQDEPGSRVRDASPEENITMPTLKKSGVLLRESDALVEVLQIQLANAGTQVGDRFPNVLARNLFLALGVGAATRRKGNNHMRMDLLLGPPGVQYGIAEVEFGFDAILNVPRDMLDDVAVMVSRYGWDKQAMALAIIGDILPNKRSEYWRIIQDIRQVIKVEVGTISILSLILLLWNHRTLALTPANNPFYADSDTKSYRDQIMEPALGRPLMLMQPSPLVEPSK